MFNIIDEHMFTKQFSEMTSEVINFSFDKLLVKFLLTEKLIARRIHWIGVQI